MPLPLHTYTCSEACRTVHAHCLGCRVLEGPDHFHRLREGLCFALVSENGALMRIAGSCWERFSQPVDLSAVYERLPADARFRASA